MRIGGVRLYRSTNNFCGILLTKDKQLIVILRSSISSWKAYEDITVIRQFILTDKLTDVASSAAWW